MECLYTKWSVFMLYGMSVHYMEYLYATRIWNVCKLNGMSV